jgi:hypothetical protein
VVVHVVVFKNMSLITLSVSVWNVQPRQWEKGLYMLYSIIIREPIIGMNYLSPTRNYAQYEDLHMYTNLGLQTDLIK